MAASSGKSKSVADWDGQTVRPGESADVELAVSESYIGMTLRIPIRVCRAPEDGPVVYVTAALHGDEINGTGAIREILNDHRQQFELARGSLVLVPVLNILAFDQHSRYLPDRRDLNRCFPGSGAGSLASRMAHVIFSELVQRCDYGIDLHTAAVRRTNYPNVRADLGNPETRALAEAFGCEIIVNGRGPKGALRRESCRAGCPAIIMEGGEVWKVEPTVVESSVRGIRNVLISLGMIEGEPTAPNYQVHIDKTTWVRAQRSGFLQFHAKPGDIVSEGQVLATNADLLANEQAQLVAPFDGVVIGMTTIPVVAPGEAVCHVGKLPAGMTPSKLRSKRRAGGLEKRLVEQLGTNVMVTRSPPNPDA